MSLALRPTGRKAHHLPIGILSHEVTVAACRVGQSCVPDSRPSAHIHVGKDLGRQKSGISAAPTAGFCTLAIACASAGSARRMLIVGDNDISTPHLCSTHPICSIAWASQKRYSPNMSLASYTALPLYGLAGAAGKPTSLNRQLIYAHSNSRTFSVGKGLLTLPFLPPALHTNAHRADHVRKRCAFRPCRREHLERVTPTSAA